MRVSWQMYFKKCVMLYKLRQVCGVHSWELWFQNYLGDDGNKKIRKNWEREKRKCFLKLVRSMRGSLDEHDLRWTSVLCSVVVGQPTYFSHSTYLVSFRTCSLAAPACGAINTNWTKFEQVQVLHDDWAALSSGGCPPMAGRLELGDLSGPFQPKPFINSMIVELCACALASNI